ncbi:MULTISPECIES: type I-E CRISPR-associated protein Cas6/Cse3/CasE [Gammaproteobacteria]|uniref:type I-E CRISPR-associated protein Cas6/Cse3/CasE n=1 Tax=Gammaproteobacteria TaxID=1236 RepID=UPI00112DA71E|nr:type I-E CRISPR-associated protein Cas6/Cse3/CasE [Pseudomonas sp. Hp2]
MHLTRLRLDPFAPRARRDLADPYEMHRSLVRAFVVDETQTPPRFLWRLETQAAWSDPQLIVQSSRPGNWRYLDDSAGYLKEPVETKAVTIEDLLRVDARYRFRLLANPTVAREGKRYGLSSEEAQLAWLSRQGERVGFRVEMALVAASDVLTSRKGATRIHLRRALFEGILRASDVAALGNALQAGIGPGKAFGCGLLSLARI